MVSAADILNAKILIVDDQEANVRLLERTLRGAGYTAVSSTTDPHEVVELYRTNRYDLILLDLVIPVMDGFQIMEGLKAVETGGYLPVLVVTVEPSHKLRALEAGARDFVSKPIDLIEVVARARNMIEVRLLHAEAQRHRVGLEEINKELDSFTHSVSHDLRSPMRLTNKIAHLLLEDHGAQLPAGATEKIQMILDSIQEMGRLVENLLHFSQMHREPMRKGMVNLRRLAGEAVEELQDEHQGREVDVVIDELPSCLADRAILKQVFLNLLANALKFTRPRKRAEIRVGFTQIGAEIIYFVRDNGVGFDMTQSESMFVVFRRLHQASQFEGSGVGLALVKRIIDRHGGRIWAEGKIDHGATFFFTLGK